MSIPVENVYYLLCYAWDQLDQSEMVDVSTIGTNQVLDLLGSVLASGTSVLIRRGLDRGYEERVEDLQTIRGRIRFNESLNRCLFPQAKANCSYDELQYDVLHNQILKTTIHRLVRTDGLDARIRQQLVGILGRIPEVGEIALTRQAFRKLQLHRNNAFYRFLMNVCELLLDSLLVDEEGGTFRFRDFLRDERKMAMLFQRFVLNFYRREQSHFKPTSHKIRWDALPVSPERESDLDYLPEMETDITLRSLNETIVIDTKYYSETLVRKYDGPERVRADNLYQLNAYLMNLEAREGIDAQASGMLLYPDTGGDVDVRFQIRGHDVSVRTINLAQPWPRIHQDLLGLVAGGSAAC